MAIIGKPEDWRPYVRAWNAAAVAMIGAIFTGLTQDQPIGLILAQGTVSAVTALYAALGIEPPPKRAKKRSEKKPGE